MPPIDYTIPGQFKGIQVESPTNAMAQAMQLRALQNQNALAGYQLGAAQRAETKETNRMRLLGEAGGDESAVANALLKSGDVAGYSAYVKAIEARETQKLTQTKTTGDIVTTRLSQFKDLLNTIDPTTPDAGAKYLAWHEANHADEYIGPLLASRGVTADQSRASIDAAIRQGPAAVAELINKSRLGIDKFRENQKAEQKERYKEYVFDAVSFGEAPMSESEWLASQQPAPASAPAPAPAPAPVEAAATAAPTSTGQEDSSQPFVFGAKRRDFGGVDPRAAVLLKDKPDELAKLIEAQRTRKELTGEFRDVVNAERMIAELEEDPTPLNKRIIASLREQIKTAQKGKGTNVNVGVKLPEAVKAIDTKYADDYLAWRQGGGSDAAGNAAQIKSVLDRLASGEALTGKSIGLAPDFFNALVNPAALGAKQQVEEVVQRNLRAVLGAQFTQVEGERLIARAFDARLSPQENAKRLRKLFMQIESAAQQKEAMAQYYEANETLRGYKGKQPSIQDFYNVLNAPDAPPKGSVDVKGPDGKTYRFPDKKSADEFKKSAGIKE
jgi:hypothetical protein